jgi:hypothetical protein
MCCTKNVKPNSATVEKPVFENIENTVQSEIPEEKSINENRIAVYYYQWDRTTGYYAQIRYSDIDYRNLPKEEKGITFIGISGGASTDRGTYCLTNIVDDNVNVRNYPSLEAEILYKLNNNDIVRIVGSSGDKVNIDNYYGDWVNVIYQKTKDDYINGWVFSKYVNVSNREHTPIRFVEFIPMPNNDEPRIKISYNIDGSEVFSYPDCTEWNNYFIIVRSLYDNDYHYTNKPGIYLLDKETMKLNHVTYLGSYIPTAHAWTIFTDDFQYLIQDSGTSAGVRGITAWRWKDLKLVFAGGYYPPSRSAPIISNNIIEIVYHCDDFWFEYGSTDEEIMAYGKKYKKENPIPQEIIDEVERYHRDINDVELLIRCSFNLDTAEREILGGKYIIKE